MWNNFAHNVIERIVGVIMTAAEPYDALKIKVHTHIPHTLLTLTLHSQYSHTHAHTI